jgi:hypothetical protein
VDDACSGEEDEQDQAARPVSPASVLHPGSDPGSEADGEVLQQLFPGMSAEGRAMLAARPAPRRPHVPEHFNGMAFVHPTVFHGPDHFGPQQIPELCQPPRCPLDRAAVEALLGLHPCPGLRDFVLESMERGVDLLIRHPERLCKAGRVPRNGPSADDNADFVDKWVKDGLEDGSLAEVHQRHNDSLFFMPLAVASSVGAKGVKRRLICDASFPNGHSINDCISPEPGYLKLPSIEFVHRAITELTRPGCALVGLVLDVRGAFNIIPIRVEQRHLVAFAWRGKTLAPLVLPFGLRSSPRLYSGFAALFQFAIERALSGLQRPEGEPCPMATVYVDDHIVILPARAAGEVRSAVEQALAGLGVPVAAHKTQEGPAIHWIGFDVCMLRGTVSVNEDKRSRACARLEEILRQSRTSVREASSLLGLLGFISYCAPGLRVFTTGFHKLVHAAIRNAPPADGGDTVVRLDPGISADLRDIQLHVMSHHLRFSIPSRRATLITDASGLEQAGGGGYLILWPSGQGQERREPRVLWTYYRNPRELATSDSNGRPIPYSHHVSSSTLLECLAWAVCLETFEPWLAGAAVLSITDSAALTGILWKGRSRTSPSINDSLRHVAKVVAALQLSVLPRHLPREAPAMKLADGLSRLDARALRAACPGADMDPVPPCLGVVLGAAARAGAALKLLESGTDLNGN